MRAATGYASATGVAIAFASLFTSALGWMNGSSDRDFSTVELFNSELYVDGDARPAIAISIWVAVITPFAVIIGVVGLSNLVGGSVELARPRSLLAEHPSPSRASCRAARIDTTKPS